MSKIIVAGMTVEQALKILNPATRREALAPHGPDGALHAALIEEAMRLVTADYERITEGLSLATAGLAGAYSKIKTERDAAVRDLELLMMRGTPGDDACSMCKRWDACKEEVSDEGSCNCRPEWRGPQDEDEAAHEKPKVWNPEVTEVCPHCDSEITMTWDVAQQGYKAFCPVCGKRLMLCDMCLHPEEGEGSCDYDSETDICKHNRGGSERGANEDASAAYIRHPVSSMRAGGNDELG